MSGHNPHGRLGQPNPPWNHLQVPSYIPRQPQLAHMSNEPRPLNVRSSPLAWHTPAHTEAALYNYMTATTHKTPLDINPLLPAFVRPPNNTPFGSVDLSLGGSSGRNNSNSSPRTFSSPANGIESNFANHSIVQPSDKSSEINNQQSHCNGDIRGTTPSQISLIPSTGSFGQTLPVTDVSHVIHSNYHPLHDSLQLVKEAIHNSLRQETGDDLHEFHQLQKAISVKTKSPTSMNTNSDKQGVETNQSLPVNTTTNLQLPPPQLTPTHQLSISTSTNQRSPSSAQHNSNSSCSSSSSSSTSSSTSFAQPDLNQFGDTLPVDDKSQTRRRSRKPSKTTRMSNTSEDGDVLSNKTPNKDDVSYDLTMTNNSPNKSSPTKVHENRLLENHCLDDNTKTANSSLVQPTNDADEIAKPATPQSDLNIQQQPLQPPESQKSTTPPPIQSGHEDNETIDNIAAELAKTCNDNRTKSPESITPVNAASFILTPITIPLVPVSLTDNHTVLVDPSEVSNATQPETQPIDTNGVDTKSNNSSMVNGTAPTKATPNEAAPSEAIFKEVENKLEEMFAGIEDDRSLFETKDTASTPQKGTTSPNKSLKKTSTPKAVDPTLQAKQKKGKAAAKKTPVASTSKESKGKKSNAKKAKVTNKSNSGDKKGKLQKDSGAASLSAAENTKTTSLIRSGPIVHVDHSGSTHVINGQVTEEVAEVKAKLKKGFIVGHHHPAGHANDRSKIRGLHLSTLSTKYDADTTDTTWMCVFCKMGPHRLGLGDLFGPYIVSTACDEFQLSQLDPTDDLFSGQHKQPGKQVQKRSLPVFAAASTSSKKKRKPNETLPFTTPPTTVQSPTCLPTSNPSPFYGMAKASETSFEVWMHGDCAVWSSGVHIIGTRIVGLEAAVWTASGHRCVMCHQYGAMLSCLQRGCKDEVHVPCARLASWLLCDNDFKSRCSIHSVKAEITASTSTNAS